MHHSSYSSPATEDFMSNISGKYAIVGVAETKVGKRPDASTHSLHLECIKACLDDAGIKAADVDGFITNQAAQRRAQELRGSDGEHGADAPQLCHGPGLGWRDPHRHGPE